MMVRWLRWHCPPDTGFDIRALAVWGRARYLSVTEAPHNTDFHTWMGKKHFCFFQTAETGNRTPNSGVKGSGANHYPRAPAHHNIATFWIKIYANLANLMLISPSNYYVTLGMKGCICHFTKWQIHLFISKGTNLVQEHLKTCIETCNKIAESWFFFNQFSAILLQVII